MTAVDVELLDTGSCSHLECIVHANRSMRSLRFPSLVVLIRHPTRGVVLFDTGYAGRLTAATATFPQSLYRRVLPFASRPEESALAQLGARGISAADVTHVILSHVHADHVAGLIDFPRAEIVMFRAAYDAVRDDRPLAQLRHAFFPGLVPSGFTERIHDVRDTRCMNVADELAPFDTAFDVFGDGSIIAIDLSGHVAGQLGILCRLTSGGSMFFVADACWTRRAFEELRIPLPIVRAVTWNFSEYRRQIGRLHALHQRRPDLPIVPSHCESSLRQFAGEVRRQGTGGLKPAPTRFGAR